MIRHARQPVRVRPIYSTDIQTLGGVVSVASTTDRTEGGERFVVAWRSRGGDCSWVSPPMAEAELADTAARVLAAFLGAAVR